jgi:hypothetical protein
MIRTLSSVRRQLFHPSSLSYCNRQNSRMIHHLMVGTWTPPGAIFTFEFNDETLTLKMIKKTEIPQDEPISWMTFDVSFFQQLQLQVSS